MTSLTTTTLAPLKQPALIQQAKAQCRLGASLFATYAILATAQWAAVGDTRKSARAWLSLAIVTFGAFASLACAIWWMWPRS
jgi:hypothetical protein